MRTRVVNGWIETTTICTSCLWRKVLTHYTQDGDSLSHKRSVEARLPAESKSTHSRVGKKVS